MKYLMQIFSLKVYLFFFFLCWRKDATSFFKHKICYFKINACLQKLLLLYWNDFAMALMLEIQFWPQIAQNVCCLIQNTLIEN